MASLSGSARIKRATSFKMAQRRAGGVLRHTSKPFTALSTARSTSAAVPAAKSAKALPVPASKLSIRFLLSASAHAPSIKWSRG